MSKKVITRKEAKALRLKNYFTGVPCKHGHTCEREVSSGQCKACKVERTRRWRARPEEEKYLNISKAKKLPSQQVLQEIFSYNEQTGDLIWKDRPIRTTESTRTYNTWRSRWCGKVAGSKNHANGYIEVRTPDNKLHKAHRVIWKLKTGEDPHLPIDHKNGITWDNSWDNLRLATDQDNSRNRTHYGKSGLKGVSYRECCGWVVQWCVADTNYLKCGFTTDEEAAKYYDKVARELYGEFARLNFPEEE